MNKSYFSAFDFSDYAGGITDDKNSEGQGVLALMKEIHVGVLRDSINLQRDMFMAMKGEHDRYQKNETREITK